MEHNRWPMQWTCGRWQGWHRIFLWRRWLQSLHQMQLFLWYKLHLPHYPTVIMSHPLLLFLLKCCRSQEFYFFYDITTCIIFVCNLHLQESFYFGYCCSNSRRALYFDFPSISVCLLNSCTLFVPITYPSCY